jgi:hypothetical protein
MIDDIALPIRRIGLVLAALGSACNSAGEEGGGGTGSAEGESGSPTSADTQSEPATCPDCDGICFEDQCLAPPEPVMVIDPEAFDVMVTEVGIAYSLGNAVVGGATAIYEQPLGGEPSLLLEPPPDQTITASFFEGDRVWLGTRYPDSLYVFDRSTSELTLVRELDALPNSILGVGDDTIFASTSDGVSRIAMDGSAEQIITPSSESVVFNGTAFYQREATATKAGDIVAYDLEGGSRRVLGTWAGFPAQLAVSGSQVVWRGEAHLGIGDGIIRTVVDDGVTTSPASVVVCPSDATGLMVVGSSVVFWSWPGPELFRCPLAGGPVTEMWTDASLYDIEYAVRGDPTLLAIIDHDDVTTLYRILWPGL